MSNIDKRTCEKLKAAAAKAVDNFDPNMFVETRDVLALLDELEAAEKRIAELEARKVTLPDERFRYGESDYDDGYVNGWNAHGIETKSALRAAGIGVKGE